MRPYVLPLILLFSVSAFAEYRAYLLKISKKPPAVETPAGALGETAPPAVDVGASREVISNLDPDQYRGYYPIKDDEVVTYTETWMCPGRTSHFKETCPPPQRTPASAPTDATLPPTSSDTATSP